MCSASHLIILFHEMPSITFCDEACKASGRFCSWEAQPDLLAQRGAHSPCLAHGLMVFDAVWMQEADPKAKRNRLVLSIFHHFFALWLIADSWRYCCDLPVFSKRNYPQSPPCEVLDQPSTMISDSCHASCKSKLHGGSVVIIGDLWFVDVFSWWSVLHSSMCHLVPAIFLRLVIAQPSCQIFGPGHTDLTLLTTFSDLQLLFMRNLCF